MEDIRNGTCPLCKHNQIIEGWPRDATQTGSAPLAVAWDQGGKAPWLPLGQLSVYVCQRCGKAEWFAAGAANIKLGPEYGTRLIVGPPPPQGPMR